MANMSEMTARYPRWMLTAWILVFVLPFVVPLLEGGSYLISGSYGRFHGWGLEIVGVGFILAPLLPLFSRRRWTERLLLSFNSFGAYLLIVCLLAFPIYSAMYGLPGQRG